MLLLVAAFIWNTTQNMFVQENQTMMLYKYEQNCCGAPTSLMHPPVPLQAV